MTAITSSVGVRFEHILVPTDFSEVSERALGYAKILAKRDQAELLLIHVTPPINPLTPPEAAWVDVADLEARDAELLEQSGAVLRGEGYKAKAISLNGVLYDELVHAIAEYNVDLIVLGTHSRRGLDRLLLGSDAEAMLRRARCPVLSVGIGAPDPKQEMWVMREVMCAIDFDTDSAAVAAYAQKIAVQLGADLTFFHVKRPGANDDIDWVSFGEAFRRYCPDGMGNYARLRHLVANPASGESIAELAKERGSSLIVMGARPASPIATHFGSGNVAKVLMEAPCPVLTLLQP